MHTDHCEFAIIIPTFNEATNVIPLAAALEKCLESVNWRAIFVDDSSPDGTANVLEGHAIENPRISCLKRVGRRGLASAVIEGVVACNAEFFAVMDADLQHDETLLVEMLKKLRSGDADLVVASRYIKGGGVGEWAKSRSYISKFATKLANIALKTDLTDPMSGFFASRTEMFLAAIPNMTGIGFKILLDYITAIRHMRVAEVPMVFRQRLSGESKLNLKVTLEFLEFVLNKLVPWVSWRFIVFAFVGGTGVVVHIGTVAVFHRGFELPFDPSNLIAIVVAMTSNFTLNNLITFGDRQLTGNGWWSGLTGFYLCCAIGGVVNYAVASIAAANGVYWLLAAIFGLGTAAVFNFATSSTFVWRKER
jgi:dolichol-phosphate mannosyltransferase